MQSITLSSPDFANGKPIPEKCAYYSSNHSPQLIWRDVPLQAKSFVLVVEDPDAPSGLWIHWVIYNISANLTGLPGGVKKSDQAAGIGTQGLNDFGKVGYDGPCPPRGKAHRYYFKLFGLDENLNLRSGLTRQELLRSIAGHIVTEGQWKELIKAAKRLDFGDKYEKTTRSFCIVIIDCPPGSLQPAHTGPADPGSDHRSD